MAALHVASEQHGAAGAVVGAGAAVGRHPAAELAVDDDGDVAPGDVVAELAERAVQLGQQRLVHRSLVGVGVEAPELDRVGARGQSGVDEGGDGAERGGQAVARRRLDLRGARHHGPDGVGDRVQVGGGRSHQGAQGRSLVPVGHPHQELLEARGPRWLEGAEGDRRGRPPSPSGQQRQHPAHGDGVEGVRPTEVEPPPDPPGREVLGGRRLPDVHAVEVAAIEAVEPHAVHDGQTVVVP
jgi:hypothetical protein